MAGLVSALPVVSEVLGLVDKLVVDKDKKLEIEYKLKELDISVERELLQNTTYKPVDAAIKILIALTKLWRPAVSTGLFIYGLFNIDQMKDLHELGTVGDMAVSATFGALPGWMASRHINKQTNIKVSGQHKLRTGKVEEDLFYDD